MSNFLIGGVPRSGKTILATRLAQKLSISHFRIDALVSAFEKIFPEHGITHHGPTHSEICNNLKPFLWEFQKQLTEEGASFILDSFHIQPSDAAELLKQNYQVIFLGYPTSTIDAKMSSIRTHPNLHDWTRDVDDAALKKLVYGFIEASQKMQSECRHLGIPFFDLSEDFEAKIEKVCHQLYQSPKIMSRTSE